MFILSEEFATNPKTQLFMAGDFDLFFDSKLDGRVGILLINMSLATLIEIKKRS